MNEPSVEPVRPSPARKGRARYLLDAVRYLAAAVGIAYLGVRLGSWLFAPIVLLALFQSARMGITALRS